MDSVHTSGELVVAEIDQCERQLCSNAAERISGLGRQVERGVQLLDRAIVVIAQPDEPEQPVSCGGVPGIVGRLGQSDGALRMLRRVGAVESIVGERPSALDQVPKGWQLVFARELFRRGEEIVGSILVAPERRDRASSGESHRLEGDVTD